MKLENVPPPLPGLSSLAVGSGCLRPLIRVELDSVVRQRQAVLASKSHE